MEGRSIAACDRQQAQPESTAVGRGETRPTWHPSQNRNGMQLSMRLFRRVTDMSQRGAELGTSLVAEKHRQAWGERGGVLSTMKQGQDCSVQ